MGDYSWRVMGSSVCFVTLKYAVTKAELSPCQLSTCSAPAEGSKDKEKPENTLTSDP